MMKFIDGPAAGVTLALRRAPLLLRVVFNPRKKSEQWDALNEVDDVAEPHEQIHLYILTDRPQMIHLSMRPRSGSGWYAMGSYKHLAECVPDEVLRDNARYFAWADAQRDRLTPAWFGTEAPKP